MNIIDEIHERFDIFQFKYFGINHLSTSFDIKLLIENSDLIKSYYNKDVSTIKCTDDFVDCLFIEKYAKFEEVRPYVNIEYRDRFNEILDFILQKKSSIKPFSYIQYLKEGYEDVLKLHNHSICKEVFDITFKYHSGLSDLIKYFINNYFNLVLDNFENIQNILLASEEYTSLLVKEKHFNDIKKFRLSEYFEVIKYLNSRNIKKDEVDCLINLIIEYGTETYNLINEDNAIEYEHIIKLITAFLIEIRHKSANVFIDYCDALEIVLDKYIDKYGQSFSCKIPIQELRKPLENKKIPWNFKMLMLTHVRHKQSKWISYHELIMKETKGSLTDDLFGSTVPYDDYFTLTKQQTLNLYDQALLPLLQYYINKERIQEFTSMLGSLLSFVCDNLNIDFKENEFDQDLNILLNQFILLFSVSENKNEFVLAGLNYGLTMFIIGLIEKFLRVLYKAQNIDKYVNIDYYNLGDLLTEKNETVVKYLGIDNVKVFQYYLIKGNRFEIGYNYRNNFAHYRNIKVKDIQYGVTLKVLQLFLMMINTIMAKIYVGANDRDVHQN